MPNKDDTPVNQPAAVPKEYLKRPEDQWFDRKSSRVEARDLGALLVGFANAEGGVIVIGLSDGRVEGVGDPKRENAWRQAARNFTAPPVPHSYERIPCVTDGGERGHLVVIEVPASEQVHRTTRGDAFLRVGDETRKLRPSEARELEYDKGQAAFDGRTLTGATRKDLDNALVGRYLAAVRARTSGDDVLAARGLLKKGVPSVAGELILGRLPGTFFPEGHVRVLSYTGTVRERGVRSNIRTDRRFEGPLPAQLDAVRLHLGRLIPTVIRLESSGRFARSTVIPKFAWLEAVVNAVIHRSYSMAGDHIRVELFTDRLEVESPGRLPGLVRLESIRSTRFARNPRIARAMADLNYGRELGEGVDRMFDEMERAGLPPPVFEQGTASVRVSLLASSTLGRRLAALAPDLQNLAQAIERAAKMTTTEAVDRLGLSRPTVLKQLHELEAHGLVEHAGSSPKDPRGFWRFIGLASEDPALPALVRAAPLPKPRVHSRVFPVLDSAVSDVTGPVPEDPAP
jgi:ATP-dependent DNA helicase RecG